MQHRVMEYPTRYKECMCVLSCLSPVRLFGSSVHGSLQARDVALPGVGCHALLHEIFPTQGSNPHLLNLPHCSQILYHLSLQRSPTQPTGFVLIRTKRQSKSKPILCLMVLQLGHWSSPTFGPGLKLELEHLGLCWLSGLHTQCGAHHCLSPGSTAFQPQVLRLFPPL